MTFNTKEQKDARASFIEKCRREAWGAACHADWIGGAINAAMEEYQKMQANDAQLEADIKELEAALDSHTLDNRNKRKALNERRGATQQQMQAIGRNAQEGQKAMQRLLESVEVSLALAKHAENWEWKEVEAKPEDAHEAEAA